MKESDFLTHELAIVTRAAAHLIAQGKRALQRPAQPYDPNEVDVVFVAPDGARCPIGYLIGDLYQKNMEGHRVKELIKNGGSQVRDALGFIERMTTDQWDEHANWLVYLANVHDRVGPMGWREPLLRAVTVLANRRLVALTAEMANLPEDARWMPEDQFAIHVY